MGENACADQGSLAQGTANKRVNLDIAFADKPGQTGVQFLFEVVTAAQGDGSFPVSKGWIQGGAAAAVYELYKAEVANKDVISELAECSDRGLDNGDGECECFDGFRGLACEEQEALFKRTPSTSFVVRSLFPWRISRQSLPRGAAK